MGYGKRSSGSSYGNHTASGFKGSKRRSKAKGSDDFFGKPVSVYTSKQAIEDGILVDLFPVRRSFVNLATTNLMSKGYINEDGTINKPNIQDLINQGIHILGDQKKGEGLTDYYHRLAQVGFASGKIELPNGEKQTVYLAKNENNTYTIMLPEDY